MTLERVRCKLTPQKCRFTLIRNHFDSSLASVILPQRRRPKDYQSRNDMHIRGVKMTLLIIVLK